MLVGVVPERDLAGTTAGWLLPMAEDGQVTGAAEHVPDLVAAIAEREAATSPRWVWPATAAVYPHLLAAGVRVGRCEDLELTEALLLGYEAKWGEPRSLAAAWARLTGGPVPPDPAPPSAQTQGTLFDSLPPPPATAGFDPIHVLPRVYAAQRARLAQTESPARFRLLLAAESAGALVAAEMGHDGLPWRIDVHDSLLRELLGEPSRLGPSAPPAKLVELTARIQEAFGGQRVHPESPADVLRAFSRAGISLPSTRAWVLRGVDHPAVPLLLEFKELYRIWTAHGWTWCAQWVRDGRFHPEYVPAGVVSGRWATRGGGALQIPKVVRRAVVADEGWTLVVADAAQLEPRVLAAVAGDPAMAQGAAGADLYAALAADSFGGDRAKAKVALLGAMYGQTGGAAVPALAVLRERYPIAWEVVERAAQTGMGGGLVRSWLGRTCPPAGQGELTGSRSRARGRFTRNFVIQGTAAEWALTLLAVLRTRLAGSGLAARLVFFQHDEVLVHCPEEEAGEVTAAVRAAGEQAGRLLFPDSPVRFPLDLSVVDCYADA